MRVLTGNAARAAVLAPLRQCVRAINASLGPHGRSLLYEPAPGGVGLASDGLTIAREIAGDAGADSIGPRILKETIFAAQRDFGDGSARLACILGAVVEDGFRLVAAGHQPQELARDILSLSDLVGCRLVESRLHHEVDLGAMANAVTTDRAIAELVATSVAGAGADGVVEVKEHPRADLHLEVGTGFSIDVVLASEHLGPAAPATILELDDVFVLVANESIGELGKLGAVLEGFASRKKSLAIVARDITGAALAALIRNRRELGLHVVALKPSDVSTRAGEVLEDLAIATGATLVAAEVGLSLDRLRPAMLGMAKRLRFARGRALFVEPAGGGIAIDRRRTMIAAAAERARYLAYDREHALRRAARLMGKWAEIRVGGATSHETALRMIDAKAAVRTLQAAMQSGVLAGGGSALVREAARLRLAGPGSRGARLCVARGLEAITIAIARNGGLDPVTPLAMLRLPRSAEIGFDARSGTVGDVVSAGIADPVSITVGIVGAALSAAATMLRIEAVVCR
jgi:chaperonin GroEL (HSP60 family)